MKNEKKMQQQEKVPEAVMPGMEELPDEALSGVTGAGDPYGGLHQGVIRVVQPILKEKVLPDEKLWIRTLVKGDNKL